MEKSCFHFPGRNKTACIVFSLWYIMYIVLQMDFINYMLWCVSV